MKAQQTLSKVLPQIPSLCLLISCPRSRRVGVPQATNTGRELIAPFLTASQSLHWRNEGCEKLPCAFWMVLLFQDNGDHNCGFGKDDNFHLKM